MAAITAKPLKSALKKNIIPDTSISPIPVLSTFGADSLPQRIAVGRETQRSGKEKNDVRGDHKKQGICIANLGMPERVIVKKTQKVIPKKNLHDVKPQLSKNEQPPKPALPSGMEVEPETKKKANSSQNALDQQEKKKAEGKTNDKQTEVLPNAVKHTPSFDLPAPTSSLCCIEETYTFPKCIMLCASEMPENREEGCKGFTILFNAQDKSIVIDQYADVIADTLRDDNVGVLRSALMSIDACIENELYFSGLQERSSVILSRLIVLLKTAPTDISMLLKNVLDHFIVKATVNNLVPVLIGVVTETKEDSSKIPLLDFALHSITSCPNQWKLSSSIFLFNNFHFFKNLFSYSSILIKNKME